MSENSPADYVTLVADELLADSPSERERAMAELLHSVVATWQQQPGSLRRQAVAAARAFSSVRRP